MQMHPKRQLSNSSASSLASSRGSGLTGTAASAGKKGGGGGAAGRKGVVMKLSAIQMRIYRRRRRRDLPTVSRRYTMKYSWRVPQTSPPRSPLRRRSFATGRSDRENPRIINHPLGRPREHPSRKLARSSVTFRPLDYERSFARVQGRNARAIGGGRREEGEVRCRE